MELDSRIKDINDIQTVINSCGNYRCLIGKTGYFAKSIKDFKNLNKCKYGTIDSYKVDDECFCHLKLTNGITDETWYPYFILEDALLPKEKKYRPYTLKEFTDKYSLGDEIIMRSKDTHTIKHVLFTEYEEVFIEPEEENSSMDVCIGHYWYTFTMLFVNYEIYTGEGWKPFGVEE